ncbi:hypothetical protein HDE69_005198 [Pedobacter cryoconitis]|uniref:KAP NTPase domain-containing protein n=1 Tax=Pedobacter cryoconitis TaxID=188932 RepID=A0A7W8YYI9_9SPHI|nr:P-loop NTPase fold protein [Pedobacter cryoconitis]MBB5624101.1 hypothetical protein [Pedobacter cryoconitis]
MKLKHTDIEIPKDDPFKNCKLNRFPYAEALTSIVNTYSEGFVLTINNPWGTGKTTFIKMWQALLFQKKFTTLYFNAWENDFDANPQVALMSELGSLTNKKSDKTFKSLIQKAAVLSNSILPALVKAIATKYIDSEVLKELIENSTQGATEILKDEIDTYAKKKKGLIDFRIELQKYISEHNGGKPLILFIDELDRCRPDYAVELLEQIKHFFSVPGIVFVLSIDKVQLGNAVKGFYGSEHIDSNEYLRRFIDLEFSLPMPETGIFVKYLFTYFGFQEFFDFPERKKFHELSDDGESFLHFSTLLFKQNSLSLRQQEKLFSNARMVLNTFSVNNFLFPSVYLMLIFVKDFHPKFYAKLLAREALPQEILDDLVEIFPKQINKSHKHSYLLTEVILIVLYNNYYNEKTFYSKLSDEDQNGKTKLLIKSVVDQNPDGADFKRILESFTSRNGAGSSLSHLLNKINLLDDFITK